MIGQPFHIPTFGDRKKAYDFYKSKGYPPSKIANHMSGIDFSYSVDNNFLIHIGDKITQWKASNIPQGDYYTDLSFLWCDCLGIYLQQGDKNGKVKDRESHIFKVKFHGGIKVLKSTAADILDTWSIKGKSFRVHGGCTQYFHTDKQQVEKIRPIKK